MALSLLLYSVSYCTGKEGISSTDETPGFSSGSIMRSWTMERRTMA